MNTSASLPVLSSPRTSSSVLPSVSHAGAARSTSCWCTVDPSRGVRTVRGGRGPRRLAERGDLRWSARGAAGAVDGHGHVVGPPRGSGPSDHWVDRESIAPAGRDGRDYRSAQPCRDRRVTVWHHRAVEGAGGPPLAAPESGRTPRPSAHRRGPWRASSARPAVRRGPPGPAATRRRASRRSCTAGDRGDARPRTPHHLIGIPHRAGVLVELRLVVDLHVVGRDLEVEVEVDPQDLVAGGAAPRTAPMRGSCRR